MPRTKMQILADTLETRTTPSENMEHLLRAAIMQVIEECEAAKEIAREEAEWPY